MSVLETIKPVLVTSFVSFQTCAMAVSMSRKLVYCGYTGVSEVLVGLWRKLLRVGK